MGAAASVVLSSPQQKKSKWSVVKQKKKVLNKEALKVIEVLHEELEAPVDGSDFPSGERLKYHALNEVRRLRAKILNMTRVPETDCYAKTLKKEKAARFALKRNPEKTQRSDNYDQNRLDQAKVQHVITPSSELTAVQAGMYAGGILREVSCSTPRSSTEPSTSTATTTTTTTTSTLVPYNIFIRRAVINLPSIPTRFSDGTKSKVNRVLKVAEVDEKANLTLIDFPPTRPEPNVVSVLIAVTPDQEGQMLKGFPTLYLSSNPDTALKRARHELKRQWGLDAHVLSYHTDPEQDTSESGWRLFEVECHDSSWVPTRLIPCNRNYRSNVPQEQYETLEGTRGHYDKDGDLEHLGQNNSKTTSTGGATPRKEVIIPRHYADWVELDKAIGVGGLEALDVSRTSRDALIPLWHELRDIKYARERSQEALLMPMYRHDDPTVAIKRAPWRQLGWYTFAVGWVDQQLAAHAMDHNGKRMQRDGPMYQITLTDEHCVFRCATRHHGDMYFSVASKKSKNKYSSVIAKYMSDIKFWRRQLPYVVGSNDDLNFLLLQDVRWRLTVRRNDMDDEEPEDIIYKKTYTSMTIPSKGGKEDYAFTQQWMKCLEAIAESQIDADFRITRFKNMKWPIVDMNEILARWKKCIEGPHIVPVLLKQGHLRQDQIDDLTSTKFTSTVTGWLERIFNESRIPDLVLVHENFQPSSCCFIAKHAGPRNTHLFAFRGIERAVLSHPFFSIQKLFDVWPGAVPYDSGDFLGDDKPCQRDRRLLRDCYLKCWKRWAPAGPAKKDFTLARRLWPLVEVCRLSTVLIAIQKDVFNQHQTNIVLATIAPILRNVSLIAASIQSGLYDDEFNNAGQAKKTGLRPVRPWPEGVVNLQSEDGSFEVAAKCNSAIDVRHLLWSFLEGSRENCAEEDECFKLQSPRVKDSYVGFDAPLHACGIRDGDTITFKLVALPPKEDDWIVDELGRMRDKYKAWPELPKVVCYGKGSEKKPRRPDVLVESSVMPKKAYNDYQQFKEESEKNVKMGVASSNRPSTPPCKKGEGARRTGRK